MSFEVVSDKSAVQLAVENALAQHGSRLDKSVRKIRTKAAMVMEVAEVGYASAKIAAVAQRAEVSSASIYRDFGDRDRLLIEALEWVIALFAGNWVTDLSETDPVRRIEILLLQHGKALTDPFMGWIFRLYVQLANTTAQHLLEPARLARDYNLNFWVNELQQLERDGHIIQTDHSILAALILGAVERRTIFSRMAFGENDDHQPYLPDVAKHTAEALFEVFGTDAFWQKRGRQTAPAARRDVSPKWAKALGKPKMLLDMPSKRLKEHAKRVLARDVNRLDGEGRRVRVQLAAMLECTELGYEDATMAGVALRAGVSTATLYADYPDKRALFLDALLLQARFRADYSALIDQSKPIAHAIASLVYSIAAVLADPDFLWYHRIAMAGEISDAPSLIHSSRQTRSYTEGFWLDLLAHFESQGLIELKEPMLVMNLLLGATQRRSVLSMVFFGANDVKEGELAVLARASTDFVLRLIGTPKLLG